MRPADLARELDIPQPTVHRLVSGKSLRPHRETLEIIANYFDVSIEQLKGTEPFLTRRKVIEIPLVEWKNLPDLANPEFRKKTIVAMADLSEKCFAVFMNDSSMEPLFLRNSILIFDPHKKHGDRSYVLAKLASTGIYVFRQIIVDAEHRFLKPLNPDLIVSQMRLLDEEDQIAGVLVEARQVYNDN